MGLAELAQRRALALVAGGDHHPGIDRRRGEQRLDRRLDGAGPGKTHGDHALAAEERHGVGLVGKAAGIVGDRRRVEADMGEGIGALAEDGRGEALGALGDQALVVAVDQDDADGRVGPRQKAVGVGWLDLNHAPADPLARRGR